MKLTDVFAAAALKRLSAVEVDPTRSNQREFNGVAALKTVFGTGRLDELPTVFLFLDDEGVARDDGTMTWYNAREHTPDRSEFRCYYRPNDVMGRVREGDLVLIARRADQRGAVVIATQAGSTSAHQLALLVGEPAGGEGFEALNLDEPAARRLHSVEALLVEQIVGDSGLVPLVSEPEGADERLAKLVEARFKGKMPLGSLLAELAREEFPADAGTDPDGALIVWMAGEERVFRIVERVEIGERLAGGFGSDVDGFLGYAISMLNRRKSRAGRALENHVAAVLSAHGIPFDRQVRTEERSTTDFIVPGEAAYRVDPIDINRVLMLAVKRTCKDRWPQILVEAARLPTKHLLTFEPGISVDQTNQMKHHHVRLVVPKAYHATYQPAQRKWLLSVAEFIELARRATR